MFWTIPVILILGVVAAGAGFLVFEEARTSNDGGLAFTNRVNVPPLLEPESDSQATRSSA